jgi:adenosine deaminase CECR1
MLRYVKEAMELYRQRSDFVKGFDLVGQEDPYNPLVDFVDPLLYPLQQNPSVNLPYFFHAGETGKT